MLKLHTASDYIFQLWSSKAHLLSIFALKLILLSIHFDTKETQDLNLIWHLLPITDESSNHIDK